MYVFRPFVLLSLDWGVKSVPPQISCLSYPFKTRGAKRARGRSDSIAIRGRIVKWSTGRITRKRKTDVFG